MPVAAQASVSLAWSPQTSPGAFNFGTVEIGQVHAQTFHLTNTGTTRTAALRVKLSGSSAFTKMRDTCASTRLAPGKSCLVRIAYTPATDGQTDTTVLTANNRTLTATYASITLSGTAHGTADLAWSESSYDFGTTAGTHQFTITNLGTANAVMDSGGQTSYASGVLGADVFCGQNIGDQAGGLAPGASCTETWTFDPTNCASFQPLTAGESDVYFTDSTLTTTNTVSLNISATCP
jgi:hypothetical protein